MAIRLVYLPITGRAEPTRLALTLGGVKFQDQRLPGSEWGSKLKSEVTPRQLPLMYIGDKMISQSIAQLRYAGKISKFEGKPLYPEDSLLALEVDELIDMVGEFFPVLSASFKIEDQAEKEAFRAKSMAPGGDAHKWISCVDSKLGKSKSGFAVGDHLTLADLSIFCTYQPILRSGLLDGVPATCLDEFKNIMTHKNIMANIPVVKAYYAEPKAPAYKAFQ